MTTYTEAEVVELLRNDQGKLSQKDYAAKLKMSAQYLSDIYQGRRPPGPTVLNRLNLEKVFRKKAEKKKKAVAKKAHAISGSFEQPTIAS